jgi:hypothetical protein
VKNVEWKDTSSGLRMPYVDGELSTPNVAALVEQANKFESWLEQQIADQKIKLAEATAWQESAQSTYKNNNTFLGVDTDRGELNAATADRRVQYNRLEMLEKVMKKFKES